MLQVYGKSENERKTENGGNILLGIGSQHSIVLSIINWIMLPDNRSSEILIR